MGRVTLRDQVFDRCAVEEIRNDRIHAPTDVLWNGQTGEDPSPVSKGVAMSGGGGGIRTLDTLAGIAV